mmetsp:Transcript_10420/g.11946  ORF Transcript_10420/g.11946 Transcript_10420/m.11946 type:complete len:227 (+) Transcript_10420:83-763(+)
MDPGQFYLELKNRPERILFVVDSSSEMFSVGFEGNTKLENVRSLLKIFVSEKSKLDKDHEFGLCLLGQDTTLLCQFTSTLDTINDALDLLSSLGKDKSNRCDFNALFKTLKNMMDEHCVTLCASSFIPLDKTFRVVLVYGITREIPVCTLDKSTVEAVVETPGVFFDVLYFHEKLNPEDEKSLMATQILQWLIDTFESESAHKTSYIFNVSVNYMVFYRYFMLLLA